MDSTISKSKFANVKERIIEEYQTVIQKGNLVSIIKALPGLSESNLNTKNELFYISLAEAYLPGKEHYSFDYLLVISIRLEDDRIERDFIYFIGPETIRSYTTIVTNGRIITNIPITSHPISIESIASVFYRIERCLKTQRLINAIEKLINSLDYENDYIGSIKLAKTIISRLGVLIQYKEIKALLGGTHILKNSDNKHWYVNFLSEDLKIDDERRLFIKDEQLYIGRSLETASPQRYREFYTIRIGSKPQKINQYRSIYELRRQYALTAGALGKEEDKSAIKLQLEKEALLRKTRELTYVFGKENLKKLPVVTPIAIEVAANLIPLVESDKNLNPKFQELIDMMRDGLQYELGHEKVPGIRVRGNETDLPDGTYIIMINEIPLVSGNVSLDRVLVNETVDRLTLLNIEGEEAVNPANGSECAWIPSEFTKEAETAGLTTWDAAGYMILHLASVIRKNFAEFVNIQNVSEQIKAKANQYYQKIYDAPGGIARFTKVLQIFAEEEVQIIEMETICKSYVEMTQQNVPLYIIVEELRNHEKIRPLINVNKRSIEHNDEYQIVYKLDDKIVELINNGIITNGDAALLALEPEPTQEILTAVRNEVSNLPPTAQNPIIMTEDWRIRRHVRKLVELEFPHLAVLAKREISKMIQPIAIITLE